MRLTPGCFNDDGKVEQDRLFGFYEGQTRREGVMRSLWYNGLGQQIGHGDLDPADLRWLMEELREDEFFFPILESHARNAVRRLAGGKPDQAFQNLLLEPGIEFVVTCGSLCLTKGKLLIMQHEGSPLGSRNAVTTYGLTAIPTARSMLLSLLELAKAQSKK